MNGSLKERSLPLERRPPHAVKALFRPQGLLSARSGSGCDSARRLFEDGVFLHVSKGFKSSLSEYGYAMKAAAETLPETHGRLNPVPGERDRRPRRAGQRG